MPLSDDDGPQRGFTLCIRKYLGGVKCKWKCKVNKWQTVNKG